MHGCRLRRHEFRRSTMKEFFSMVAVLLIAFVIGLLMVASL
jgi:hypothetical protein